MRTKLRKALAVLLCMSLCLSLVPGAWAEEEMDGYYIFDDQLLLRTQNRTQNFSKNYTLTGNGASNIIAVAAAQVGKSQSDLGYSEAWCADFLSDCADLAGVGDLIPRHGAVSGLRTNIINSGADYWDYGVNGYISNVQAGDILVFKHDSDSHISLVEDTTDSEIHCIDGNWSNAVQRVTRYKQNSSNGMKISSVLRPQYPTGVSSNDFITYARSFKGKPYVSGGRSPSGFDCCGFVWYVCNHFGIDIGTGNQSSQINYGTVISYSKSSVDTVIQNMQVGDLLYFDYGSNGSVDHVAIYTGNGNIINAENSGVLEHTLNQSGWPDGLMWTSLCGIRRVLSSSTTPTNPGMTTGAGQTIADGDYIIASAANTNYYLDIGGSDFPAANNTNVGICGPAEATVPAFDVWRVTYIGDGGFYKICQTGTDMSLDLDCASVSCGANIQVYPYHDSPAQKWSIRRNTNGSYSIFAKCSGFCLDIYGGNIANSTNVQQWITNDSNAQQWTFIPYSTNYTVSYNANGGSSADMPKSQTKTRGSDLTLSSTVPPTWVKGSENYTVTLNANGGSVSPTGLSVPHTIYKSFNSWNTKADGSGTRYYPGGTYSTDASATLYAQWDEIKALSSVDLPTPTRDGYIFKGWGTSSSATSGVIGDYCPHGDVTLYATWEQYNGIASGKWGELSWSLDYNGVLTISGSGKMNDFWYLSTDAWLAYKNLISKAVIKSGVTSISRFAFSDCVDLKIVEIPSSVTKLDSGAFFDCSSLKKLTIPSTVTTIGDDVFSGCGFETAGPIGSGCDFEFPWTTEILENVFEDCETLKSVIIPSGVTSIGGWAFHNCESLESVTIPASVTNIGQIAFAGCVNLRDVYYSGTMAQWNAISVATNNAPLSSATIHYNGGDLLYSGTWGKLVWTLDSNGTLNISGNGAMDDFPTLENGEEETRAWRPYLEEIRTVVLENGVTSISASAFTNCANMTSISIPQTVADIGLGALFNCSSLENINVDGRNSSYCDLYGVLFDKNMSRLIVYPAGRSGYYTIPLSVTSIDGGAFTYCGLTGITIQENVTSIGDLAFVYCSGLLSVVIPENVTSIGQAAFAYCEGLRNATIQANIPDFCFLNCSSLENLTIRTGAKSIGRYAFYGCSNLTGVSIPSSVQSIGECAFYQCSSLLNVSIPSSVTSIGASAFMGCSSLTSVSIPSGVTSIGNWVFSSCSSLTSVSIPASVTSIGDQAFYFCNNLTNVYYGGTQEQWNTINIGSLNFPLTYATIHYNCIPDFILPAALTTIGEEAFMGGAFTYVKLPEGCLSIGKNAFANCPNLAYIYIPALTTDIDGLAFGSMQGLTIFGKTGSYAQTYAQQKGFTFVPVA